MWLVLEGIRGSKSNCTDWKEEMHKVGHQTVGVFFCLLNLCAMCCEMLVTSKCNIGVVMEYFQILVDKKRLGMESRMGLVLFRKTSTHCKKMR